MKNYTKTKIGSDSRSELHKKLALTGAEISINQLSRRRKCSLCAFSQKK